MLGDAVTILASSRRPRPRHRHRHLTSINPSSYLLAFLATISNISTADALVINCENSPAEFLCPALYRRSESDLSQQLPSSTRSTSLSSSSSHFNTLDSRDVPDHYVKGTDGLWYQLPYATTIPCPSLTPAPLPVDIDDTDDVADVTSGPVNSASIQSSSSTTTMSIKLPAGWQHSEPSDVYRVPLIIVSAVILACIIVVLIVGMVVWRRRSNHRAKVLSFADVENKSSWSKKRRRKRKKKATEKETDSDSEDDLEGAEERDGQDRRPRIHTNIRAKATARWKAHARWIHRRSRGKQVTTGNTSSIAETAEEDTHTARTNTLSDTNQESIKVENNLATTGSPANSEVSSDVTIIEHTSLVDSNCQVPSGRDTSNEEHLDGNIIDSNALHRTDMSINEILSSPPPPPPEPSRRHRSLSSHRSVHDISESNSIAQLESGDEFDLEEELLDGLPPAYQRARLVPPSQNRYNRHVNEHTHSQEYNDEKIQIPSSSRDGNSSDSLSGEVGDLVDRNYDGNTGGSEPTQGQVAHVATDDKQVLARIADMASEPPMSSRDSTSAYMHSHDEDELQPPYPSPRDLILSEQAVTMEPQHGLYMQASVPEWPVVEDDEFEVPSSPSSGPSGSLNDGGRLYSDSLYFPPPPEPNFVHSELELQNETHYPSYPYETNYLPQHSDFVTDLNSDLIMPSEPPLENAYIVQDAGAEDQRSTLNQPSAPSMTDFDSDFDVEIDIHLSPEQEISGA